MESSSPQTSSQEPMQPNRRGFFSWLTYALGAVAAAILGIPVIGFFVRTRKAATTWVNLGKVSDFAVQETRHVIFDNPLRQPWDGMVGKTGVFVRYEGKDDEQQDQFLILAVNCAHLGCPVSWFPQSGLFMCPCHGGVYYASGERASGPPPRGLFHCVWRVRDGQLEIEAPHYPTLYNTLKQEDGTTT